MFLLQTSVRAVPLRKLVEAVQDLLLELVVTVSEEASHRFHVWSFDANLRFAKAAYLVRC
jgi:hypothetical protein